MLTVLRRSVTFIARVVRTISQVNFLTPPTGFTSALLFYSYNVHFLFLGMQQRKLYYIYLFRQLSYNISKSALFDLKQEFTCGKDYT